MADLVTGWGWGDWRDGGSEGWGRTKTASQVAQVLGWMEKSHWEGRPVLRKVRSWT